MTASPPSVALRLLLIATTGVVGLGIGGLVGRAAAENAEPLVGGAIVALSAIVGGVIGLLAGALAAWKLPRARVRLAAWLTGVPAAVLLILAALGVWRMDQATRDPETAYTGLPVFTAILERDPLFDPVLAPRVEVDASARRWRVTLPDGRRCAGRLRAEVQRRVGAVLPSGPAPPACRDAPASDDLVRVIWRIEGKGEAEVAWSGAALVDQACRSAAPQLQRLAAVLSMAPSLGDSAASCD